MALISNLLIKPLDKSQHIIEHRLSEVVEETPELKADDEQEEETAKKSTCITIVCVPIRVCVYVYVCGYVCVSVCVYLCTGERPLRVD